MDVGMGYNDCLVGLVVRRSVVIPLVVPWFVFCLCTISIDLYEIECGDCLCCL